MQAGARKLGSHGFLWGGCELSDVLETKQGPREGRLRAWFVRGCRMKGDVDSLYAGLYFFLFLSLILHAAAVVRRLFMCQLGGRGGAVAVPGDGARGRFCATCIGISGRAVRCRRRRAYHVKRDGRFWESETVRRGRRLQE